MDNMIHPHTNLKRREMRKHDEEGFKAYLKKFPSVAIACSLFQ